MVNFNRYNGLYLCCFQGEAIGPDVYEFLERPEDGVNIHGLFIDAGRWDMRETMLVDPLPGQSLLIHIYMKYLRSDNTYYKVRCKSNKRNIEINQTV